jgi:hypothetical protein
VAGYNPVITGPAQQEKLMPTDPRKRQKKQERRAAKRKEKKHLQVRQQSAGLADRLTAATRFPILHCWIGDDLGPEGIGTVILSRELPGGQVAVASFLVDRYCLGVKDAFGAILGRASYNDRFVRQLHQKMPMSDAAPADARKLVEEAVAYARGLGLAPHPDYPKVLTLFGPVNAADSTATFEFGKDGKPLFVAGPHDTLARSRQIIAILTNTCGPGGFDYVVPLAGPEFDRHIPEDLDEEMHPLGPYEEDEEVPPENG